MKHTQGPWRFWTQRRPESEDTCTFVSIDNTEVLRAVTKTITEADARLIAAAPDLLDALKEALAVLEAYRFEGLTAAQVFDEARAAIEKAEK